MRRNFVIGVLLILSLGLLSGCNQSDPPAPTAAVEAPAQGETTAPPTEAPVETAAPSQPENTSPAPVQPPPVAPIIDGQFLMESRCDVCHAITKITDKKANAAEWEAIVTNMLARGAQLTLEEKAILVQYLAENYK